MSEFGFPDQKSLLLERHSDLEESRFEHSESQSDLCLKKFELLVLNSMLLELRLWLKGPRLASLTFSSLQ